MARYTGGCLCGGVTYEVDGPLRDVIACHCVQCRKTSGHYVAATSCATADLTIKGEPSWYRSSGSAQRAFCGVCGGNLFWRPGDGERTSIFAGTLDGETGLKITSKMCVDTHGDYYEGLDVPVVD